MNKIIMDLDNTIAGPKRSSYADCQPDLEVIAQMRMYREMGFGIVIMTARNMRTYEGNVGLINVHTLPVILEWLKTHDVPYDEVIVGKPWCGPEGFYVDDRALRPDEFTSLSPQEIKTLLAGPVSGNEARSDEADK